MDLFRERVYLQTDKQTYLAGELLWFKLITTTIDGKPSSLSKVAYVELLDESKFHVQIKIDIANGIGEGWMVLPAMLSTGYYRIVAYTRYMRNEGTDIFFEKNVAVINTFTNEDKSKDDVSSTASVSSVQSKINNTISVTTDHIAYPRRGGAKVLLNNLPENIHTLSVSIAGKDLFSMYGKNDISQWCNNIGSGVKKTFSHKYLPEYEGHIVSGNLVNVETGQIEYDKDVIPFISYIGDKIRFFTGQINEDGNVLFYTKRVDGTKEISTSVQSISGKSYRVDVEPPFETQHSKKGLQRLVLDSAYKHQLLDRSVALQALYTYTNDFLNQFEQDDAYFSYKPQNSYLLDEYTRFVTMEDVITEFVNQVRIRKTQGKSYISLYREDIGFSTGNSLVLLDGVPVLDHTIILKYNPILVRKLDVYYDRYVLGGQVFDGIISFYTYNLNYPELEVDRSTQFFDYEGTQSHRPFYMPVYNTESERQNRLPDFRHTLYWNPYLVTDGSKSLSLPFYTSDLSGNYTVKVEGLTTDGKVIEGVSEFKVE